MLVWLLEKDKLVIETYLELNEEHDAPIRFEFGPAVF